MDGLSKWPCSSSSKSDREMIGFAVYPFLFYGRRCFLFLWPFGGENERETEEMTATRQATSNNKKREWGVQD